MATQRLETISQPLPLLPSGATLPSLAFFPLAVFLLLYLPSLSSSPLFSCWPTFVLPLIAATTTITYLFAS